MTDPERVAIRGLQNEPTFRSFAIDETGVLDAGAVEKEVVAAACRMVERDERIKAVLLECSLLPPYAAAVRHAVSLPVFDYVTMIDFVFNAVVKKTYAGFIS